jgi:hypothetical protein
MQTSHMNDTTAEEFDANIASVVWPEGWAVEKVGGMGCMGAAGGDVLAAQHGRCTMTACLAAVFCLAC